jgi:hypothetical protein
MAGRGVARPGRRQADASRDRRYTEFVGRHGAKGLAYIKVNDVSRRPRGAASADREIPAR